MIQNTPTIHFQKSIFLFENRKLEIQLLLFYYISNFHNSYFVYFVYFAMIDVSWRACQQTCYVAGVAGHTEQINVCLTICCSTENWLCFDTARCFQMCHRLSECACRLVDVRLCNILLFVRSNMLVEMFVRICAFSRRLMVCWPRPTMHALSYTNMLICDNVEYTCLVKYTDEQN